MLFFACTLSHSLVPPTALSHHLALALVVWVVYGQSSVASVLHFFSIVAQWRAVHDYLRAHVCLLAAMTKKDAVRLAPAAAVEAPVKSCGLAEIKVARIQSILNTLMEEKGECTLEYVRKMSEEEVKVRLYLRHRRRCRQLYCMTYFDLKTPERVRFLVPIIIISGVEH